MDSRHLNLVQPLQVGQPFQIEDVPDEMLRVLHFRHAVGPEQIANAGKAPVVRHLRVYEILVDGGQFDGEYIVQAFNHAFLRFHGWAPCRGKE